MQFVFLTETRSAPSTHFAEEIPGRAINMAAESISQEGNVLSLIRQQVCEVVPEFCIEVGER